MATLTPQRKRLTNEQKLRIIEDSKRPDFCRKTTIQNSKQTRIINIKVTNLVKMSFYTRLVQFTWI